MNDTYRIYLETMYMWCTHTSLKESVCLSVGVCEGVGYPLLPPPTHTRA